MNNQIPFFMPMYPRMDNNVIDRLNLLEKRLDKLEERVKELENSKIIKLNNKNNYENFKEGYMI